MTLTLNVLKLNGRMQNNPSNKNTSFIFCDFTDEHHCNKLLELIDDYLVDPMGGGKPLSKNEQENLILGLSNQPSSFVLFILYGEEIAGLATCFINFSTFKAKRYLNIHDLVVLKEFRGKGLGRKLLNKCIDISLERDFCKITLEVRDDNVNAQSLYSSLNFKDSEPVMHFWTKIL